MIWPTSQDDGEIDEYLQAEKSKTTGFLVWPYNKINIIHNLIICRAGSVFNRILPSVIYISHSDTG